jgi:hypothetical protein
LGERELSSTTFSKPLGINGVWISKDSTTTFSKPLGINGVWISKDSTTHHYHINHSSICGLSDILRYISDTHDTSENPDTKCTICKRVLTSKQYINIHLEKSRNDAKESKFLLKYKTSPVDFLTRYLCNPENVPPTLKKLISDISKDIDGINIEDILSEGIIRSKIICKDQKFYAKIPGVIVP